MSNKNQMRKFVREYLAKFPSVQKIYDAVAGSRRMGSEITVSNYVRAVAKFTDYLGFSDPETALQAMLKGEVNGGEKVDSFIDYELDVSKMSHSTVRGYTFGLKKWFELNGLTIDWKKIELPTSTETVENDRAPTKDELKKLLNHASRARDRFVIFADTSSGLRIGTLLSLKIGDVDLSYPDLARITVERKRGRKFSTRGRGAGRFFVSFMSPEAKNALTQYLTEREQAGEVLTPESPLVSDYNYKGQFISLEAFEKVWHRLLKKAGLNQKSTKFYVLHIHTLRKYFRSNCIGIDASYRERWMGHKGAYLDMSYFKAEESLHLAEYRKAIPNLTIYTQPTEEKKLRSQMLVDFAKLQGYSGEDIKKLQDVLARAKDVEEAVQEFRKFKDDTNKALMGDITKPKHLIAKGEEELLHRLDDGYKMVNALEADKFLLERL